MGDRVSWRLRDRQVGAGDQRSREMRCNPLPPRSANHPRATCQRSESRRPWGLPTQSSGRPAPQLCRSKTPAHRPPPPGPYCGCAAPNPALTCFCTSASLSAMTKAKLDQGTASSLGSKWRRSKPKTKTQDRTQLPALYNPGFRFLPRDQEPAPSQPIERELCPRKFRPSPAFFPPKRMRGMATRCVFFKPPPPQLTRDYLSRTKYFVREVREL